MGIAPDIHDEDIDTSETPQMYLPYAQNPSRIMHLLVRTQGAPLDWAAAARGAIQAVGRDEPLFDVKTLEEIIAETFSAQRTLAAMLSIAAGLAMLLAATGIYALLAWSVSRRTREIGIRIAIGAVPADVARLVLRQALQPAMAGILLGAIGAFALQAVLRAWRGGPRSGYICIARGDSRAGVGGRRHRAGIPCAASGPHCRATNGMNAALS